MGVTVLPWEARGRVVADLDRGIVGIDPLMDRDVAIAALAHVVPERRVDEIVRWVDQIIPATESQSAPKRSTVTGASAVATIAALIGAGALHAAAVEVSEPEELSQDPVAVAPTASAQVEAGSVVQVVPAPLASVTEPRLKRPATRAGERVTAAGNARHTVETRVAHDARKPQPATDPDRGWQRDWGKYGRNLVDRNLEWGLNWKLWTEGDGRSDNKRNRNHGLSQRHNVNVNIRS